MSEPLAITALLDDASEHLEDASRGNRSVTNAVLALHSILLALNYPDGPLVPGRYVTGLRGPFSASRVALRSASCAFHRAAASVRLKCARSSAGSYIQ
jgi:hypothetical protein